MNRADRRRMSRLWTPPQMESQQPEVRELNPGGPNIRLLVCKDEKSIDELPDFKGNPADDVLLSDLLLNHHVYASGTTHEVALITVPAKLWNDPKLQPRIVQQISAGGSKGLAEVEGSEDYYDTKNTYQADALACFNKHNRPKGADCIDYRNPEKRIGNPTGEGWKSGPRVYLCQFCPVEAKVRQAKQAAAGL